MLYLIDPVPIGDDNLVATNIPENEYPVWDPQRAYARGERVIVRATHKVYQAVAPVASATPPQNDLFHATDNPAGKWLVARSTSRWAPFDGQIGAFVRAREMVWRIRPGVRADSIALFGLYCSSVRIDVLDASSTIVESREQSGIDPANVTDSWDYFVNPLAYHTEMVFRSLPMTPAGSVRITVLHTDPTDAARVGEIVIGNEVEIGVLGAGAQVSFQDFSRKEFDEFGGTIIVRRAYADRAIYPVLVQAHRERFILRTLGRLRATPAVFHAGPEMVGRGLTVLGFFRDVPVSLTDASHSTLSIEVEGLT